MARHLLEPKSETQTKNPKKNPENPRNHRSGRRLMEIHPNAHPKTGSETSPNANAKAFTLIAGHG
jgi:hypothetical protein